MANIKVRDLTSIAGVDPFIDSESFMRDLSNDELEIYKGGFLLDALAREILKHVVEFNMSGYYDM